MEGIRNACSTAAAAALAALVLLSAGPARAGLSELFFHRPERLDVELRFTPTDEVPAGALRSSGGTTFRPLSSIRLSDGREGDRARIGENREEVPYVPVRAVSPVGGFAEAVVKELWARFGGSFDPNGLVLSGELLDFFAEERRLYRGSVRIRFRLEEGGRRLWEGTVSAERERFGRSLKADNYREVLSDSLQGAILALAEDRDFQAALAGRGPSAPAPVPAPPAMPATDVFSPSPPGGAPAGSYAPPPQAVEERTVLSPGEMKEKLGKLAKEGFDEAALLAYVKGVRLSAPLSAEEMIDWKRAGIPPRVVEAALGAYAP